MKKFRKLIQSIFIRHIIGPEPVAEASRREENGRDLEMIRFSVWQSLRSAHQYESLLLDYTVDRAAVMDELRMEGWKVQLQAAADGSLAFVISADRSGMVV